MKIYGYLVTYEFRDLNNELLHGNITIETNSPFSKEHLQELKSTIISDLKGIVKNDEIIIMSIFPFGSWVAK